MATATLTLPGEVFLDTSYLIALAVGTDSHHERAVTFAELIRTGRTRVVTTDAILLELGNAFSKLRYRSQR